MKRIIIIVLLLAPASLYSQEDIKMRNEIDSLKRIKSQFESEIQTINSKIKSLEEMMVLLQFEKTESYIHVINQKLQIQVREKESSTSRVIYEPKNGETLKLIDYGIGSNCWLVSVNNNMGYVNEVLLKETPQIVEFKQNIIIIKSREIDSQKEVRSEAKKQELINNYGVYNADRIIRQQYWVGMTGSMALESLGSPDDINKTVGSWGVHEQWVYDKRKLYLYFEDNKLTSFQTSK